MEAGIGKGIALCLAQAEHDVAISCVSKMSEAGAVAETIRSEYGRECFCYQAKLQERGAGKALFDQAVADLGGLDLMVNNAGLTLFEPLQGLTDDTLDLLINLDFVIISS